MHFYDPHSPYDPPEGYRRSSDNNSGRKILAKDLGAYNAWLKGFGLTKTWEVRSRYRGEVAYTDTQIGVVIDLLKQNSLDRNTIIFVAADHGELLGERGLFYTHAGLYEPTIHVPFIAYGKNFKAGHISEFMSGVDITPTILELAGGK
jgi:arylsulfatase A-like enzyme